MGDSDSDSGPSASGASARGRKESDSSSSHLTDAIVEYLEQRSSAQPQDRKPVVARSPKLTQELSAFLRREEKLLSTMRSLRQEMERDAAKQDEGERDEIEREEAEREEAERVLWQAPKDFAGYHLVQEIARGGMGIVYKAHHKNLDRIVALKVLPPGRFASEEELRRFQLESRTVAALDHRNIVPVYDVGEDGGVPFFSMKYLDGSSLAERMPRFGNDYKATARLVATIARAVDYAHKRGVLHRDLKPANILFDSVDQPHVSDFGLAKLLTGGANDSSHSGTIVGTPKYMAPEQARGQRGSPSVAADVYSLGMILYELLAGRPAFVGDGPAETLILVLHGEAPRPSRFRPGVPRELEPIALKCLQKTTGLRYATAGELADDLERYLEGLPIQACNPGVLVRAFKWGRRRPAVSSLIVVVLVAAMTLLAMSLWVNTQLATATLQHAQRLEAERVINRRYAYANVMKFALAAWKDCQPDRALEYLERLRPVGGQPDLRGFEWHHLWRLLHRDELERRVPTHASGPTMQAAFSTDGTLYAALAEDGTLGVWDVTGKPAQTVFTRHLPGASSIAFFPEGKSVATAGDGNTVRVWALEGDDPPAILVGPRGSESVTVGTVSVSPDGMRLAAGGTDGSLTLWNLSSQRIVRTLTIASDDAVEAMAFSPGTGSTIATRTSAGAVDLWEVATGKLLRKLPVVEPAAGGLRFSPDGDTLLVYRPGSSYGAGHTDFWDVKTGAKVRSLEGHDFALPASVCAAFSPAGDLLATGGHDHEVRLTNVRTGKEVLTIRNHPAPIAALSFDAEGTVLSTGCEDGQIRRWDLKRTVEPVSLPGHEAFVRHVRLLAGGHRVLTVDDDFRLREWSLEAGEIDLPPQQWTGHEDAEGYVCSAVSADAGRMVGGKSDGTVRVFELSRKGHGLRVAEETCSWRGDSPVRSVALSDDANALAVATSEAITVLRRGGASARQEWTSEYQVGLMSFARKGRKPELSPRFRFSPDGHLLAAFINAGRDLLLLDLSRREAGRHRLHASSILDSVFSADSRWLVTGHRDGAILVWKLGGPAETPPLTEWLALTRHAKGIECLTFLPDGRTLAAGGADGSVILWDLLRGASGGVAFERAVLSGHEGRVVSLAFSADGRTLVSGGGVEDGAGEVVLWRGDEFSKQVRPGDSPVTRAAALRPE